MAENRCAICNCLLHRGGDYARPSIKGRSHATRHHHVAERFFGRSATRRGTQREPIFASSPWNVTTQLVVLCYDCHEELVHNPVFLPADIAGFSLLANLRGLQEDDKTDSREKLGGRIQLLHEVIEAGLQALLDSERVGASMGAHNSGLAADA